MSIFYFLSLVILMNSFTTIYCVKCTGDPDKSTDINFDLADLSTSYKEDGREFHIEAFKLLQNEKYENSKSYEKQKWFSIGFPRLVETNQKERIFHFTEKGFYVHIEMLTDKQRSLLIAKMSSSSKNFTYNIDQINNLILTCFQCVIKVPIEGSNEDSEIPGAVSSFKVFPLRMDFSAINGTEERKQFNKALAKEDIEINCSLKTKHFYSEFKLHTEKSVIRKFNDKFDCHNGGLWSCINEGKCDSNGLCLCKDGYSGDNCAHCKYKFKRMSISIILTASRYWLQC